MFSVCKWDRRRCSVGYSCKVMSIWLETFEIELISGETFISNVQQFKSKLVKMNCSIHFTAWFFTNQTQSSHRFWFSIQLCVFLVAGWNSSYQLVTPSMTLTSKPLVKLQTTQHVFTSSVVVEGSSTSSMTSDITLSLVRWQTPQQVMTASVVMKASAKLPTSPRHSSESPLPTFTDQPSSTCVCPSSSAVYSSLKLSESSPVNDSQKSYSLSEANATQIYNLNGTPTISIIFFFGVVRTARLTK